MTATPTPLTVHLPEAELQELRRRLDHVRWPLDPAGRDWSYGVGQDDLRELCAQWRAFDWPAMQERINRMRHQRVVVGGLAASLFEKWRAWTVPTGGAWDGALTETLLATLTLYWASNTISTANRTYSSPRTPARALTPTDRLTQPVGSWSPPSGSSGWFSPVIEARHRGAGGPRVTMLPPNVVHDGRVASAAGFRRRVLYVGTDVLDERLTGPAVDTPDLPGEPALLNAVGALHRALGEPDDALAAEAWLAVVAERLRTHLGEPPPAAGSTPPRTLAGALSDLLEGHLLEPVTLDQAGRELGASPAHLVRCFTRQFKRHVGTPPGRYARSSHSS